MTISFFTNYVNHHQIALADELYKILGDDYHYIATRDTQELVKAMSGYGDIRRPYIIYSYEDNTSMNRALNLAVNSDVMIYSTPECLPYVKSRYIAGKHKLVFEVGERWLKKGLLNLLSPNLIKYKLLYHTLCPKEAAFKLCASAYAAHDENIMLSFKDKCFKWGYFTAVQDFDIEECINSRRESSVIKILWIARFIQLKHPEKMLHLALKLRKAKVDFIIDMIGEGPLFNHIKNKISTLNLTEYVHLLGVMPNSQLVKKICEYHIFCFTSDKREGWGAVLNEAMSAGCCPVVNRHIGSAPFLIKDGENGFMYDGSLNDLACKVEILIRNRDMRERMSIAAYRTMVTEWNPRQAAQRLVAFCESYYNGTKCQYMSGPMSVAEILH